MVRAQELGLGAALLRQRGRQRQVQSAPPRRRQRLRHDLAHPIMEGLGVAPLQPEQATLAEHGQRPLGILEPRRARRHRALQRPAAQRDDLQQGARRRRQPLAARTQDLDQGGRRHAGAALAMPARQLARQQRAAIGLDRDGRAPLGGASGSSTSSSATSALGASGSTGSSRVRASRCGPALPGAPSAARQTLLPASSRR